MGSSKTKTTSAQTNSLPDWLTTPYQQTLNSAQSLISSTPAIGTATKTALDNLGTGAAYANNVGTAATNNLSGMASGNFGTNGQALTDAASGSYVASNPFAQNGQPTAMSGALNGYAGNGQAIGTSSALNGFAGNGGLDTGYIDQSLLNKTASGDFLSPSSNPYIASVANQAADSAQARINAQFGSAGRSNGSGLYAQLFGQGITNASDQVYNANYQSERDRQQSAQNTLLGAQQSAREAALGREYGAAGSIFGAENSANENAAQRQYGATTNIFGAQNQSAESAAARQAAAYEAERQRQQSASTGLISDQLAASGQIPGLLSAMTAANNSAANAGEYADTAALNRFGSYGGLLSQLAAPYAQSNGTSTSKTSTGIGSILGSVVGSGLAGFASGGFRFG